MPHGNAAYMHRLGCITAAQGQHVQIEIMQAGPADFLKGLARRNAFLETRLRALHGAAEFTLGEEIAAFRFADEREVERRPGGEQAAQGEESSQPALP